ncbi:PEPxxWA-CTERM sorting domain-containing protein [Sphingomonas tabacisoli]|uniref:PEPxxWA-CTERM sorting domain-containing protein n=1 Tax=Sphingomonas tabacisoli TaxID=2249466 RepID=A0ABW4I5M0_9SPHN
MTRAFLAASAVLALTAPAAANTVITFETQADGVTPFPAMSNSPGAAVPAGSQLSNQFLATNGVTFSSGAGYVAVVDHVPGCGATCTPTPPNIIGGTAANGTLSYSTPITAAFFSTANTSLKATTGFVRVLGDKFPDGSIATLEAYGVGGNLLGSVSVNEGNVFGQGADLSLSLAGIQSVRFYSNGATIGFDNFEFGELSAVPEPASWALMIAGFAMTGLGVRRRARPAIA